MSALVQQRERHLGDAWKLVCNMKVRVTLSQCTQYMLAYFDLLAAGHSAELGEEAELDMTKENEHKVV